ncbi:MAG TPA: GNAT family N-acetyltransferase [Tepidisphaeraceae bacterium]|nr:GNAT family N-acetyltransferase [Tepidisphaeraceae bacterium]
MPLNLRWVGEEDLDRVAQTRLLCYAHSGRDAESYRLRIRDNPTAKPGDFLLAEKDGTPVGTATSLSMTMWVRGVAIPCQGVAWVGTVKTHRRKTSQEDGVASQLMRETLRKARERGQVVSALMPFRGSFYEHFGYGFVERRNEWTLPLSVLPQGSFDGIRFYEERDLDELVRFRQRVVERGQCDIERPRDVWAFQLKARTEAGFVIVDRPETNGPIRGFLCFEHEQVRTKDHLRVMQINYEDIPALQRQLHFLASLRDQYFAAILTLPIELPLNWLLKETQLPHRLVNHDHAELRQDTRMQVRILDHKKFLESLRIPEVHEGQAIVEVRECEGQESRFKVEMSDGRITVFATHATPDFVCPDRVWAAVACGDLSASRAVELGLAQADGPGAGILDTLALGQVPFCHEYF